MQDSGWDMLAWLAITLGVVLRGVALLADYPLGLDEAMVALSIMERSYGALLQPLDHGQAAPPLFLWLARFLGRLGTGSELALRLVPFVAGLVVLVGSWWYARRVYSPEVGAFAALLVAVSRLLIDYSVDLKPYMGDAAVTVLMLTQVWRIAHSPAPTRGMWWLLGVTGLLALGFSFTAPLVLATAGVGVVVLASREAGRLQKIMPPLAVAAASWLGVFAVLYFVLYEPAAHNPYMQEFWSESFLSSAGSVKLAVWIFADAVLGPLPEPLVRFRVAFLVAAIALLVWLAGRGFGWTRLLMATLLVTILTMVSLLGLYPIHRRLVLCLAPVTLTVLAAGIVHGLQWVMPRARARGAVTAVLAVMLTGWLYVGPGGPPGRVLSRISGVRMALARPDSAAILVTADAGPRWAYYTTNWVQPDTSRLQWFARELSWGGAAFRDTRDPVVVADPDVPPLSPPGAIREFIARSSGSAHTRSGRPVPGWAAAELGRVAEHAVGEVWVFAGMHHRRDLADLVDAAERLGYASKELHRSSQDVVLVLTPTGGRP